MGERERDVVHLQGGGRFWVFVRYDKLPAKKGFTLILRALKELSQMVKKMLQPAQQLFVEFLRQHDDVIYLKRYSTFDTVERSRRNIRFVRRFIFETKILVLHI